MSDVVGRFDPAIGMLEFDSIVAGIVAGDAMAKASPVTSLYAGTVHPGRYLVLVGGATAAVEIALEIGGTDTLVDSLFLADVHPAAIATLTTADTGFIVDGDALGIVETSASATAIVAADTGVKAADVTLLALRLADDLGGKAYCLFTGLVADVDAAVESSVAGIEDRAKLIRATVIPQLHAEMADNLAAELRFNRQLGRLDGSS
ncbi:MAG: BMC domain-containing protein [Acidimicrobiia bacterium]|nr:BMC domain-containing protein [Acidimicrobiia bacterium]